MNLVKINYSVATIAIHVQNELNKTNLASARRPTVHTGSICMQHIFDLKTEDITNKNLRQQNIISS